MIKKIIIFCFLCLTFLLQSCSDNPMSREDEIKQYIERGVEAAENRSSSDLADMMHENYRDHKRLDKKQIRNLLRAYFFRHKNIFLFTKIREIKFDSDNEASVTLHVAMAGSVIADTRVLSSLRARMYKFKLQLVKQGEWLLQHAQWQQAGVQDMQ